MLNLALLELFTFSLFGLFFPMKTKSDRPSDEAMEVVFSGMSGRFPLSDSVDEFWDNLVNKVNMVSGINDRLPQSEDSFPASMAVLKDIGLFDAAFFGINHTAADAMGSAQRILYEVVFEAIMDAGKIFSAVK